MFWRQLRKDFTFIQQLDSLRKAVSLSSHMKDFDTRLLKRMNHFPHGCTRTAQFFTKRISRIKMAIGKQLQEMFGERHESLNLPVCMPLIEAKWNGIL